MWQAEGHMPFGNFSACCTVYFLQAIGPATAVIAPYVIPFFVAAPTTAATAAFVSLSISPVVWRVTSRNRTSIRNKLNLKVRGI